MLFVALCSPSNRVLQLNVEKHVGSWVTGNLFWIKQDYDLSQTVTEATHTTIIKIIMLLSTQEDNLYVN